MFSVSYVNLHAPLLNLSLSSMSRQGNGSATQGEISFLSWNSKVQHILSSASFNGTTGKNNYSNILHTHTQKFMYNIVDYNIFLFV